MESTSRDDILEGLNVFRALESWGAQLYAAWAEHETDPYLRAGHLIIAEREANHARLLAERLRALGAQPGPACVDQVLADLKAANERDRERMAGCRAALDRGFAAAEAGDAETHRFWAQLYSEERVSGGWYRSTYSELNGKRPRSEALPVLGPDQVVRRARSAAPAGEPVACAATA